MTPLTIVLSLPRARLFIFALGILSKSAWRAWLQGQTEPVSSGCRSAAETEKHRGDVTGNWTVGGVNPSTFPDLGVFLYVGESGVYLFNALQRDRLSHAREAGSEPGRHRQIKTRWRFPFEAFLLLASSCRPIIESLPFVPRRGRGASNTARYGGAASDRPQVLPADNTRPNNSPWRRKISYYTSLVGETK